MIFLRSQFEHIPVLNYFTAYVFKKKPTLCMKVVTDGFADISKNFQRLGLAASVVYRHSTYLLAQMLVDT